MFLCSKKYFSMLSYESTTSFGLLEVLLLLSINARISSKTETDLSLWCEIGSSFMMFIFFGCPNDSLILAKLQVYFCYKLVNISDVCPTIVSSLEAVH